MSNFKIFGDKVDLQFAPITILTGTNGSGKSTVTQALKFLGFLFDKPVAQRSLQDIRRFELNHLAFLKEEEKLHLDKKTGALQNLLNKNVPSNFIEFEIPCQISFFRKKTILKIKINTKPENKAYGLIDSATIFIKDTEQAIFELKINYNYSIKINFNEFYDQYLQECNIYKDLRDVYSKFTNSNENSSEHRKYKERLTEIAKSICDIELNNIDLALNSDNEPRFKFVNDEIGYNFETNNALAQNKVRLLHDFIYKFYDSSPIVNLKRLEESYKIKNSYQHKLNSEEFNQIILSELSKYRFRIGSFHPDFYYDLRYNERISNPVEAITKLITEENDDTANHSDFISRFGREFFANYVYSRISQALNSALNFKVVDYIEERNFLFDSRIVDKDQNEIIKNFHFNGGNALTKLFLDKWLSKFGIGTEVRTEYFEQVIRVLITRNNTVFNLVDEGYGISRILPVLLKIVQSACKNYNEGLGYSPGVLILQEPETGLHPSLQSQIPELLYDAFKTFNIQFIAETHSEYLIRKFQVMISSNEFETKPEDVLIHYFYHPNETPEGENQVFAISISEQGFLSKPFGKGFLDEASTLNIALYNRSNIHNN